MFSNLYEPTTNGTVIGLTITIGGILFQSGKQAERLDFVFGKVEAQEKKGLTIIMHC